LAAARGKKRPAPGKAASGQAGPSPRAGQPGQPASSKPVRPPKGQPKPEKPAKVRAPRDRTLVALAEVARPHGIAGELRLKVYNPESDLLQRRPPVSLRMPDGSRREATITAAREADKALLVRLAGVEDRNAAEALRGAQVCVPRAALPPPAEGEFYAWDIEGAQAVLTSGEPIGEVLELVSYPTCDVLVVERPGGRKLEVPLVPAYVARVDVGADHAIVEIATLEGLD
jgi:16S rRNA processing protein RimM